MTAIQNRDLEMLERARQLLRRDGAGADLYNRWFHETTGQMLVWPSAGAYRAAILHHDRYESGWRVISTAAAPGACVVMRGGRQRVVAPPELIPEAARDLLPARGSAVRVHPLTSSESGGFWHLWSAGWQAAAPERMERIYIRVDERRPLDLASRIASASPARSTWAMKALCGVHDAGRRDRALLYVPQGSDIGAGWIAKVVGAIEESCDEGLPPFVQPIGRGVGWAPDPGGGQSFGQAVCAAVSSASALVEHPDHFTATVLSALRAIPGFRRPRPEASRQ